MKPPKNWNLARTELREHTHRINTIGYSYTTGVPWMVVLLLVEMLHWLGIFIDLTLMRSRFARFYAIWRWR